jgi:hypothetical protein
LTLKDNYTFGEKDCLFLFEYVGQDIYMITEHQGSNRGNRTATLRWNQPHNLLQIHCKPDEINGWCRTETLSYLDTLSDAGIGNAKVYVIEHNLFV